MNLVGRQIGLPDLVRCWDVRAGAMSVAEGVCGDLGGEVSGWIGDDSPETSSMTAFLSRSTETAFCFPFMSSMKYLACLRSTW